MLLHPAVLLQQQGKPSQLHPCALFPKKLTPVEQNYDIVNCWLLAIKLALEEWRHWQEGVCHPLFSLQTIETKFLNPRQARWTLLFTCFDFMISYCPGTNVKSLNIQNLSSHQV